ncbi:MAG: hypothetical protein U1F10_04255 [Burkholderiales bacterium]
MRPPSPSCAGELGAAQRPAHYLAIPPVLFGKVVEQLAAAKCTSDARVVVEKPFGRDLASAQKLNAILHATFDESHVLRIDHYLGKRPGCTTCCSASPTSSSSRCGTAST